jgi:hypothetical protein
MFKSLVNNLPEIYHESVNELYTYEGFSGPCVDLALNIWENAKIETILSSLADCSKVNSCYTKNKFTPLTLAAIQNNLPAMEALKQKSANLNAKDLQGYTALHHMAMMGNEAGVKKLLEWKASSYIRTGQGATYMDFLRFNAPFRNGSIPLDPKLFSAHTNDRMTFDMTCIPKDVNPVDEMVSTPEILMLIYAEQSYLREEKNEGHPLGEKKRQALLHSYDAFKRNPPRIEVKPVGNFCGLFANEPIKRGSIIAEYTGKLTSMGIPTFNDGEYAWTDYPAVDSGHFRSPASMANEGFPNAAMTSVERPQKGLDGIPNRKLLFAIQDIEPGKEIQINYGNLYDLKWNENYQTLGFEALQKYLASHSWDDISLKVHSYINKLRSGTTAEFDEVLNHVEKTVYILGTPSVFKKLVHVGLIEQKDLEKIRRINKFLARLSTNAEVHHEKVLQLGLEALKERQRQEL